jgi:hypothetical protein
VILAVWLTVSAAALLLRLVLVPAVALVLTILRSGDERSPVRVMTTEPLEVSPPAPPWLPPLPELDRLPVSELRRRARAAGLPRSLSRSGRRADLLPALMAEAIAV